MKSTCFLVLMIGLTFIACLGQENSASTNELGRPRIFITDSESWEMRGSSGGAGGSYGGSTSGGARPQTAEIIKTFGERCPGATVNNIQEKTDYVVVLDHEGGKGALRHKNKVAVFSRVSGDSIVSKSTLSLGGSVQCACQAIETDWSLHGAAMRAAAVTVQSKAASPLQPVPSSAGVMASTGKLTVLSVPDGADIEVDGSFVGNTPSDFQLSEGEHSITIKKAGFRAWERKMKLTAGSSVRLNANLDKAETP